MWDGNWKLNQANLITFVLVDATGVEVPGLGNAFTLEISKNGGAFAPSAGVKAEMANGFYSYQATVAESNTIGVVSIRITHAAIAQQNLEYIVEQRNLGGVNYTYTVTNSVTGFPIDGVAVWIATDVAMLNIVWEGNTDALGVARDVNGNLPFLDSGNYFLKKQLSGLVDDNAPAQAISVSP